jgi:hypothetical protein
MKNRPWFIGACILTLLLGGHVRAQNSTILGFGFTAPILALPGQTISVCTFDWLTGPVTAGPVTITQEIVDVSLNASIAQRSITLPISPYDPYHTSPCVHLTVPATATSPAGPGELFVGAVILYPAPADPSSSGTQPPALLTASVNVSGTSVQTMPIPVQYLSTLSSAFRQGR